MCLYGKLPSPFTQGLGSHKAGTRLGGPAQFSYKHKMKFSRKWVIPENIHTSPRRKLEVNPPTPFGCPNTFTIIRNNFFFPPPQDGRNFLRGGSVDLFWNDPILTKTRSCLKRAGLPHINSP